MNKSLAAATLFKYGEPLASHFGAAGLSPPFIFALQVASAYQIPLLSAKTFNPTLSLEFVEFEAEQTLSMLSTSNMNTIHF